MKGMASGTYASYKECHKEFIEIQNERSLSAFSNEPEEDSRENDDEEPSFLGRTTDFESER